MPILHFIDPGHIWQSSKFEIILSLAISKTHTSCNSDNLMTYVTNSGEQKKYKRFSYDIFCSQCFSAIFVEGLQKYICPNSEHQPNEISSELRKKHISGQCKRLKLKRLAKGSIQSFVLCTLCIKKCEFPMNFLKSKLFHKDLPFYIQKFSSEFDRNRFKKLNFQNAILPSFVVPIEKEFISKDNLACKLDIKSCFPSSFENPDLHLPSTPNYTYLVQASADKFFHQLKAEDKSFGIVKGFFTISQQYCLPFLPVRKDGEVFYTFCRQCNKRNCDHSDEQRRIMSTVYLHEALYMKFVLNYKVLIFELYHFVSAFNTRMKDLVQIFKHFRAGPQLISVFSKRSILSALGRGAFRLDKTVRSTTFMTTNCSEFQMNCLKPNLLHFDVHDHILGVSVLKNKIKNSDMKRLGYSLNLMNYFYGAASSFSRMEIYRFIIFQQTISPRIDLALIRFDVDSVIFVINGDQSLGWNLIHNFLDESTYKYKIETKSIKSVKSFGKQSQFLQIFEIINGNTQLIKKVKTCGVAMSIYDRKLLAMFKSNN